MYHQKKRQRNKHYKQCFIKRLQGNIETKGKNQSFSALNGRPLHDQVQVWAEQLSSPPAKLIPRLCLAKHMILSLLSVVYSATGSLTDPCPLQETCHKTTSFLDEKNFGCLSLPVGSVATAFIDFSSDRTSPNKKCALQCKNSVFCGVLSVALFRSFSWLLKDLLMAALSDIVADNFPSSFLTMLSAAKPIWSLTSVSSCSRLVVTSSNVAVSSVVLRE